MELMLHIDTQRSLSMEEVKELDTESKADGVPPHELVIGFIRRGLTERRRQRESTPTPTEEVSK